MERPNWLNNKTATIFGVIFFPICVIFAFRLNSLILTGVPLSGGRLYWRQFGWAFLCGLPFFGLIYGLVKLNDIVEVRNRLWDATNAVQPQPQYAPPPPPPPPQ